MIYAFGQKNFLMNFFYEFAAQISEEDKMDTSEPPVSFFQTPKHGCTTKSPDQKTQSIVETLCT